MPNRWLLEKGPLALILKTSPQRGDAQEPCRRRPSPPDRSSQVIVHRQKESSTSQQEDTNTNTLGHAVTELTNTILPLPNLDQSHKVICKLELLCFKSHFVYDHLIIVFFSLTNKTQVCSHKEVIGGVSISSQNLQNTRKGSRV
jgi:hypothetical protein